MPAAELGPLIVSDLDHKFIRSSAWIATSTAGTQLVSFLVMIVLARLLTPSDFGLVALSSLVLVALAYIQASGLGAAVVRTTLPIERAAGTQLVFSTAFSFVLFVGAFASAPLFARIFSEPDLTPVMRVLALVLVFRGLNAAPAAILERQLTFRPIAMTELRSTATQATVSLACALAGLGIWSLVAGQLAAAVVQTASYWSATPFRPSPRLASFQVLRELGRYGRHITAGNVLQLVTDNADNAVIGRILGATSVGQYNLAWRLANLPALEISAVVGRVAFPIYTTISDDVAAFRAAFLSTVRRIAFVALPVSIGLLVAAQEVVLGVFGGIWEPAVAPLQVLAVLGIVRTFSGATGAVFQASGRPHLNYLVNLWHASILFPGLILLGPRFGITGIAVAELLAWVCSAVPALRLAFVTLDIRLTAYLRAVSRPLLSAGIIGLGLLVTKYATASLQPLPALVAMALVGFLLYATMLMTLARDELEAVKAAVRSRSGSVGVSISPASE